MVKVNATGGMRFAFPPYDFCRINIDIESGKVLLKN